MPGISQKVWKTMGKWTSITYNIYIYPSPIYYVIRENYDFAETKLEQNCKKHQMSNMSSINVTF